MIGRPYVHAFEEGYCLTHGAQRMVDPIRQRVDFLRLAVTRNDQPLGAGGLEVAPIASIHRACDWSPAGSVRTAVAGDSATPSTSAMACAIAAMSRAATGNRWSAEAPVRRRRALDRVEPVHRRGLGSRVLLRGP